MPSVQHITVTKAEAGQKLCSFLMRRIHGLPKSVAMRWIRTGQVRVDSRRCKPFMRLDPNQDVRLPPYTEFSPSPENRSREETLASLNIIHREKDFLLINKPSGLPIHPGTKITDDLVSRLHAVFADDDFAPTPVHRLDKPTSGVVLIARNYNFLRKMHARWKENRVDKFYLAWVEGRWPEKEEILLQDKIYKDKTWKMTASKDRGKEAQCLATPLWREEDKSLLRIKLLTGRTHQIRAQLSMRGHPIPGDDKYGGKKERIMYLHALLLDWGPKPIICPPAWSGGYAVSEEFISIPGKKALSGTV